MGFSLRTVLPFSLLLPACAHAPAKAEPEKEIAELRHRLAEGRGRETDLQRKLDELSNRLLILQDQVESRDVARQEKSPPRVPVDVAADRAPAQEEGDIEYAG